MMTQFVLKLSEEDRATLKALSLTNTGGNESELLRRLLRVAAEEPEKLRLREPLYLEETRR